MDISEEPLTASDCTHLIDNYKLEWSGNDTVEPAACVEGNDVEGVARILGEQITAVHVTKAGAGQAFPEQAPPRHGLLARFTGTVSTASRAGEWLYLSDVTVTDVEVGKER